MPGDGRVIEGGQIAVQNGRIVSGEGSLNIQTHDLGDLAIVPGLINCHAHLEFSDLVQPLPPAVPFTDWLRALMGWRGARHGDVASSVVRGLQELARSGCTRVGEIATEGWLPLPEFLDGPVVHAFRESIGLKAETIDARVQQAEAHFDQCAAVVATARGSGNADATLPAAISPHAPYSVRSELLRRLVTLSRARDATVAMHVAETRDELELLATGSGRFVDFLTGLGVWQPGLIPTGRRPLDVLRELSLAPRTLVVHGNYLAEDELDYLASNRQMTLVYCPRTHAWFQHEPHPWRDLLSRGGRVVLGTDGRGSNPDLSIFREAQFLAAHQKEVNPSRLFGMLTADAALALSGSAADYGRISPGSRADLTFISLGPGEDLFERMFHPEATPVGTMVGGRWLVSPPSLG